MKTVTVIFEDMLVFIYVGARNNFILLGIST